MMKYLEGEEITNEELKAAIRKATINVEFFPVLCGSTAGCCYPCNRAPVVVVQPDMEWLGPITPDGAPALVKRLTR